MEKPLVADMVNQGVKEVYFTELEYTEMYSLLVAILCSMSDDENYKIEDVYKDIQRLTEQVRQNIGRSGMKIAIRENDQSA